MMFFLWDYTRSITRAKTTLKDENMVVHEFRPQIPISHELRPDFIQPLH